MGTKRADGHHVYFRAALCGSVLFVLALGMRSLLDWNFPAFQNFDSALTEYVRPALKVESGLELASRARRTEWIVTAAYSLVLGMTCGSLANLFTPRNWARERGVSTLYRLLFRAFCEETLVCVTLQSGKVYVGYIAACPDPTLEPVAVPFRPTFSGNRDASGQFTLTTDYESIHAILEKGRARQIGLPSDWRSDLNLQIRADEIISAANFSLAIYTEFNPNWRQQLLQPNQFLSSIGTNLKFSGPT